MSERYCLQLDEIYACQNLPRTSVYAADLEFCGTFLKPTSSVPSTVQLLSVPEAGVPSAGVTNVGLVAKTSAPSFV
jgi:hypothetical protein